MSHRASQTLLSCQRESPVSDSRVLPRCRDFAPHPSQAAKQPTSQDAKRPTSLAARQRAFTLVEILAAFVIFALAFGAVMQALSGSIRNTVQSRGYTQAALMARSHLDQLGITEPIEAGGSSGELAEGYRYELEVREWEPPPIQAAGGEGAGNGIQPGPGGLSTSGGPGGADGNIQPRIVLYKVDLKVRWGEPPRVRQAEFSTVRSVNPEL